jgi:hypothetical protein
MRPGEELVVPAEGRLVTACAERGFENAYAFALPRAQARSGAPGRQAAQYDIESSFTLPRKTQ